MSEPKISTTVIKPDARTEGEVVPGTETETLEPRETVETLQPRTEPQRIRPIVTVGE